MYCSLAIFVVFKQASFALCFVLKVNFYFLHYNASLVLLTTIFCFPQSHIYNVTQGLIVKKSGNTRCFFEWKLLLCWLNDHEFAFGGSAFRKTTSENLFSMLVKVAVL